MRSAREDPVDEWGEAELNAEINVAQAAYDDLAKQAKALANSLRLAAQRDAKKE